MPFSADSSYAQFWLEVARGDLATWIQLTPYVYAVFEGIHLVGVAFFFGPIFLLDLRLLGLMPQLPVEPAGRFLLNVAAPAFVLLTLSGALLFVPSADRYAASPIFFLKLSAIGAGGVNALLFHTTAWRRVDGYERRPEPWRARTAAVLSVAVWVSVIVLGRAMGYETREAPDADLDPVPGLEALGL
jgi:hypothetical protein